MSHVTRFNLKLDNETRLRSALTKLGSVITEGYFTSYYGSRQTSYNNKPVAFGFSLIRKGASSAMNRLGFIRDNETELSLVGDMDGTGWGRKDVENAINNAYVNETVDEIVPDLMSLGFVEEENTVQLAAGMFA